MQLHLFFFLTALLASLTSHAMICHDLFAYSVLRTTQLPSYQTLILNERYKPQLDLDAQIMLMKHPIFRFAKYLNQHYRNLSFEIPRGMEPQSQILLKGENIQGQFVREILHRLFPESSITQVYPPDITKKNNVIFFIEDPAEMALFAESNANISLDINMLKSGNPGLTRPNREYLRNKMDIPFHRQVVSIYVDRESTLELQEVVNFLQSLITTYGFQDILVSIGTKARSQFFHDFLFKHNFGKEVFLLSEVNEKSARSPLRWILNDTIGLMQSIHAVADLSLVVGPINFIEPVSVKTPTIWMLPPDTQNHYDVAALEPNVNIAELSHGFDAVYNLNSWERSLKRLLMVRRSDILVPAYIQQKDKESPFHQILTRMQWMICQQLQLQECF